MVSFTLFSRPPCGHPCSRSSTLLSHYHCHHPPQLPHDDPTSHRKNRINRVSFDLAGNSLHLRPTLWLTILKVINLVFKLFNIFITLLKYINYILYSGIFMSIFHSIHWKINPEVAMCNLKLMLRLTIIQCSLFLLFLFYFAELCSQQSTHLSRQQK